MSITASTTLRSNVSHDHSHGCTKKGSLYIHR